MELHRVPREGPGVRGAPPPAPVVLLRVGGFRRVEGDLGKLARGQHPLGAHGGGDHGEAEGPRVHDLALDPRAEPKRGEEDARVAHRPGDGRGEALHQKSALLVLELPDRLRGVRAVDAHRRRGKLRANEGPHLVAHPAHGVHVGGVVEGAYGDEPVAIVEPGRRLLLFPFFAEEGGRDELGRGDAETIGQERQLHGRTHEGEVAPVHARELAGEVLVPRLGHRRESRRDGIETGRVAVAGGLRRRLECALQRRVPRVSEGVEILHVEHARGVRARGADAKGEGLLRGESIEDDGVGGGRRKCGVKSAPRFGAT